MKYCNYIIIYNIIILLSSCSDNQTSHHADKIFSQLSPKSTGIQFSNRLTENDSINYLNYGYIYMGGGVAIGDVNNDGLQDVYLTGNMVENKLYLNMGDMEFEDITKVSRVGGGTQWITGVTMADVNANGWIDIYVSVSGKWESTRNLLFINKGTNDQGIPIFEERADSYGIADEGQSTQSTFFDYDNDGDLDLYVCNYPITAFNTAPKEFRTRMENVTDMESNTLYRNNGNESFTDITENVGLKSFGLSLSSAVGDFNQDGWMDIYVSNDFVSPDNFYFYNSAGTFNDLIDKVTQQTSFFGMGTDASDFNNDGLLDLFQLDMTPEDNRRSKANMQSMNIKMFDEIKRLGFHTQYMQNALQLNVGTDDSGLPHFSNIPRLAGVALSDWSWTALFADFDNDGWKDLFITNGTRREINNKDFFNKLNTQYAKKEDARILDILESMPSEKIENYVYRNNGDLTFSDVSEKWGLNHKGFSNGAAYADLDNDGDLDLIVNNLDEISHIYENKTSDNNTSHFLQIELNGNPDNRNGIGANVSIWHQGNMQYQELVLSRGFQSSVSSIIHFGLGTSNNVDSILVVWPDGKQQILENIHANEIITIDINEAKDVYKNDELAKVSSIFENITKGVNFHHRHVENKFNDYFYQVLLPHKMSQFGPALAVGDIDNDGLDDVYIGGASGQSGVLYRQEASGGFVPISSNQSWEADDICEDMGAAFFDANGDGFLDLYVVSGGNEFYKDSRAYQDRLYMNNQKGGFRKDTTALPNLYTSGSVVVPSDFDMDGDIDLFVGGRHTPRNYPMATNSYLLRNDQDESQPRFTDISDEAASDLIDLGMVTDAIWTDFNGDNALDLIIVGEWMPITFLANERGIFVNKTVEFKMEKSAGWWFSIEAADYDKDGDTDYIAGNLGLNYKYQASREFSFDIYAADYDNNKSLDIVLGYYNKGEQYPVRGRECSSQQIPAIKIKFKDYNSYAEADLADVYSTQSLDSSLHFKSHTFASSYIENLGQGKFKITPLPNEAQFSSINSILTADINKDQHLDIIISGNLYSSEVETPRNDASYGLYLEGNGNGQFKPIPPSKSGMIITGDVKDAEWMKLKDNTLGIVFARNNESVQLIKVGGWNMKDDL